MIVRGNLKEFCCHLIPLIYPRIDELLKKKSRKRVHEARIAELRDIERSSVSGVSLAGLRAAPPLGLENKTLNRPTFPNMDVNLSAPVIVRYESFTPQYQSTTYPQFQSPLNRQVHRVYSDPMEESSRIDSIMSGDIEYPATHI